MIDWRVAEWLAGIVAEGPRPTGPAPGARRLDLRPLAQRSEHHVVAYTGLRPARALPPAEAVDRRQWIGANAAGLRELLEPVVAKVGAGMGPMRPALRLGAGLALTAEVGVVLGYLSQRVLGQYELVLLEPERPSRLLFVTPNLEAAVRNLGVEREEFLTWVALHETTHAVQFAGVPWLHEHLGALVRELMDSLEVSVDAARALRLPGRADLRRAARSLREGGIVALVAAPEQRAALDRVQAVMAVIEGYAEHVMDAVGAELLPTLPRLRTALDRRRRSASVTARLLNRLLGLDIKLRQYEVGKRFCDAVAREGGLVALNRVWSEPDALPSLAELDDPAAWRRRTHVPSVTK